MSYEATLEDLDRRVRLYLVLTAGFSKDNTNLAMIYHKQGKLMDVESKEMLRIYENPTDMLWDDLMSKKTLRPMNHAVLDALNYRLSSEHDGNKKNSKGKPRR